MILVGSQSWIHFLRPTGSKVVWTRAAGVSVPATDILIAACAWRHDAELETAVSDFERLATL